MNHARLARRIARCHSELALATGLTLGAAGPAGAMALTAGSSAAPEHVVRQLTAAPVAGAVFPSQGLVAARIEAVDAEARTLTLLGAASPVHATALRVVGPQGQALAGLRSLRPGMTIRFALEPEAAQALPRAARPASPASAPPPVRRIVLIYIDA